MKLNSVIKTASGIAGAVAGFLYGEISCLFAAVIALMALDYITGVLCGISAKNLSSETGFRGLVKKLMILVIIAVAHLVDFYIISTGSSLMTAVIMFFAANEGISILENAARLGLPIPDKLKGILKQLKEDSNDDH